MNEFYKRIGYEDDLSKISKKICKDFNLGRFKSNKLIEVGYEDFNFKIETNKGKFLECADNHIIFGENFNQIFVKDLKIGNYIQTDLGLSKVVKINKSKQKLSMFDLTIDHPNHRFYTNGILSHNTVSAAITILHFIAFNVDKNVMVVANLRATTIEIVDKIKSIYVNLPYFLKPGIRNWNQTGVVC